MINIFIIFLQALWFICPAYIANAIPVLTGGGIPIDGGKNFTDGRRILGDGKTIRGFFSGLFFGSFVGYLQLRVMTVPSVQIIFGSPNLSWRVPLLLSFGALLGDIFASFLKRRVDIPRGEGVLGIDQLDFVIGGFLMVSLVWVPDWKIIFVWLVITPLLHLSANRLAYEIGIKSKPY